MYRKLALRRYSHLLDQLPLFDASPRYDPPVVHFSPAEGGFTDKHLMELQPQELLRTANEWLKSAARRAIPPQLLEDILNEDCVIFLGAGASTEGSPYKKPSLADMVAEKCSYPKKRQKSLPLVSQYFCEHMNGRQKGRLVRLIRSVIDEYMKNGEAYRMVTMCHSIVARIPQFRVIVTTNWDVFMERLLNVIAIVRDEDMAYWSDQARQVIKMHGCITQPATMVITKDDYDTFLSQRLKSPIINKVADLMATKTFLFLGYSLRDPDFKILHDNILTHIGRFARHSFAVMRNPSAHTITKWKKKNISIIPETGISFLRRLHSVLVRKGVLFSEDVIDRLHDQLEAVGAVHFLTSQDSEVGLLSAMYQDGLQHGLDGMINTVRWGTTKGKIQKELGEAEKNLRMFIKVGNAVEIAYWNGRVQSLTFALKEAEQDLKLFFSAKRLIPIDRDMFLAESAQD